MYYRRITKPKKKLAFFDSFRMTFMIVFAGLINLECPVPTLPLIYETKQCLLYRWSG